MPYKDKNNLRKYQQEWYERKKLGLTTKTKEKITKEQLRQNRTLSSKKWRENKRKEADKVFGINCSLCNSNNNTCLHEKSGKPHNRNCTANKALKNPEKWARLCYPCHKAVHWNMKHFHMTWEDIKSKYDMGS